MEKRSNHAYREKQLGDQAVDGLFVGIAAGVVMLGYLLLVAVVRGMGISVMLSYFAPGSEGGPLAGAAAHAAVSGIYGALFALGAGPLAARYGRRHLWPTLMVGALYGVVLFVLAIFAFLPGTDLALRELAPVHLAAAHLLYGLTLAWLWQWNGG